MFCDRCGTQLAANARHCSNCGKDFGPAAQPSHGIAGHVKVLGVLWIVHGGLLLLPGLVMMTIFTPGFLGRDVPPFVFNFVPFMGGLFLMGGALSALVGIGLLMRLGWARMLALVLGGLNLLNVPLGTALGVYTFWVLLPSEREQEYRALTQTA